MLAPFRNLSSHQRENMRKKGRTGESERKRENRGEGKKGGGRPVIPVRPRSETGNEREWEKVRKIQIEQKKK